MTRKAEGDRYVRQIAKTTWTLWECRDGRYRRVGTARCEAAYLDFLGCDPGRNSAQPIANCRAIRYNEHMTTDKEQSA